MKYTSNFFHEDRLENHIQQLSDINNYQSFTISKLYDIQPFYKKSISNASLLIIDDEVLLRDTASYLLKLRGYKVFTSSDINDGLKIYQNINNKIDIVILNLQLANIDYRLSIPAIFSINNDSKIIGFSKNLNEDDLPLYFKNSLSCFLNNSYSIKEITKAINSLKIFSVT